MDEQERQTLSNVGGSKPELLARGDNNGLSTSQDGSSQGVDTPPAIRRVSIRPSNLDGVPVPGGKSHTLRKFVYQVFRLSPHLCGPDVIAVARYAALSLRFMRGERRLAKLGETTAAGEPRKLASEQRFLAAELRMHEAALGITAASRAALGVNVVRMQDLASLMAGRPQR